MPSAVTTYRSAAPSHKTSKTAHRGGETHTATSQVAAQNPAPLPSLQVRPGFRIWKSMEQAAETTSIPVPKIDDRRPFCLSYHLKGMCNSNCGGRHAHMTLSSHKQGVLSAWKSRFCAAQPPVTKIAAPHWAPGGGSVGNTTLSARSQRSQGTRGTRSRDTKTWHTMLPPMF